MDQSPLEDSFIEVIKEITGVDLSKMSTQKLPEIVSNSSHTNKGVEQPNPVNAVLKLKHEVEKLELKVSGLENELEWAKEAIKSKDQMIESLQSQLNEQKKKRESYHDNPGSSDPVQPAGKVAGGK